MFVSSLYNLFRLPQQLLAEQALDCWDQV